MYGTGLAKGLLLTLRHFVDTYVDDLRYGFRKYSSDNFEIRQGTQAKGAFTVQYPDEKVAVPERFRFVPFLVVEEPDHPDRPGHDWCTSCGICPKVCPPQCIWIVRGNDPVTGKPVPEPEAFFIDIDLCMNCGYCAEYCPFDAIKMDHDYELASYDRTTAHIHDKEKLSKTTGYWKSIAPTRAAEEAEARGGWEHKDTQKAARRGGSSRQRGGGDAAKRQAVQERKAAKVEAEKAAPVAAAPTVEEPKAAAEGKTPWTEGKDAMEKRRLKALERKAKRAAQRAAKGE